MFFNVNQLKKSKFQVFLVGVLLIKVKKRLRKFLLKNKKKSLKLILLKSKIHQSLLKLNRLNLNQIKLLKKWKKRKQLLRSKTKLKFLILLANQNQMLVQGKVHCLDFRIRTQTLPKIWICLSVNRSLSMISSSQSKLQNPENQFYLIIL